MAKSTTHYNTLNLHFLTTALYHTNLNQDLGFQKKMNSFTNSHFTFSFSLPTPAHFYRAIEYQSLPAGSVFLTVNALAQTTHSSFRVLFLFLCSWFLPSFLFHAARGQPYAPNTTLLGTNTKTIFVRRDKEKLKGGKVFGAKKI